ncbi:MAG: thioesterase domain-containing protein [Vicinamibacteria bacterium]
MTVAELLASLRARDVALWRDGDRLRCSAPAGVVDEATKEILASRKQEILAFLRHAEALGGGPSALVPLKADGRQAPIFAFPGHNGDVFCFVALARRLDADQPLFGVEPRGLAGDSPLDSVEALAEHAVGQIRSRQPRGPYRLAGYCAGGTIAFEAARRLAEAGETVELLALIGSAYPTLYRRRERPRRWLRRLTARVRSHLEGLTAGSLRDTIRYVKAKGAARKERRRETGAPAVGNPFQEQRSRLETVTLDALGRYSPRPYAGRVVLFLPSESWRSSLARPHLWRKVAGDVREHVGPDDGELDRMLKEPGVGAIAAVLGAPARAGGDGS